MTQLFDPEDEDDKVFLDALKKFDLIYADKMEVPSDLCLKNIVFSCFDYDYADALFDRANFFIEHILNQPRS